MAVLRVEIEIDGDVYPELHAALLGIAGDASRTERLRQLAASGLVWEKIRVHGPAMLHGGPAAGRLPAAAASAEASASTATPAATTTPTAVTRKAAAAAPKPRARAPEPLPAPPPGDFVDLALDAAPLPPPPPRQAPRAPPVLMDIVDPEDVRSAPPAPLRRAASLLEAPTLSTVLVEAHIAPIAPAALPAPVSAAAQVSAATQVSAAEFVPARQPPDELEAVMQAPPDPALEHRASTRSRLQRMKERGLFKNG